ncbi:MAG: aspartyl/asparaginyl beta-hydroxylase domain-containing protein [Allosphingosinicella sp.]
MQLSNQEAEGLLREGVEALRRGQAAEARVRFERVTQTGRANGQIWLLLATACRGEGDAASEEAALDQLLALEPRVVRAHIMKADCRARADDERGALSFYKSALFVAEGQQIPNDLLPEMQRAREAAAQMEARLDRQRETSLTLRGLPPGTRSARFQESLDVLAGRKQIFLQQPTSYYFPGLPQVQYYDPAEFDWVAAVEAATPAIQAEIRSLLATGTKGFRPYIQSDPNRPRMDENQLLDSAEWSALFLCENGRISEEIVARCPQTWEAMQAAPLPRITNSPTVMFSLLRPGARINPHTGMYNTRLICHLPLIVPPGCRFRVGNEVREWAEGKLLIFDDTIEHEAWNDSGEDRVVLIFDIWRPELSAQEREEVGALFSGPALE